MRGACSTLPRARSTAAARRAAQANRPQTRPMRVAAIPATPLTAHPPPAAGDSICMLASPSAAVPMKLRAGARWPARPAIGSLRESAFLLAGGSQLQHAAHTPWLPLQAFRLFCAFRGGREAC